MVFSFSTSFILARPILLIIFSSNFNASPASGSLGKNTVYLSLSRFFPVEFSALSEEEQKKIGYFNYWKIISENENLNKEGWSKGFYEGVQETMLFLSYRMFTLEDISKTFVGENEKGGLFDDYLDYRIKTNNKITFKEWYLTQTLSQKLWKIECVEENGKVKILKLL
jgi:hypothetical protein